MVLLPQVTDIAVAVAQMSQKGLRDTWFTLAFKTEVSFWFVFQGDSSHRRASDICWTTAVGR